MNIAINFTTLIGNTNKTMKTLSLITVGRDDKFADDFIDRLHKSISTNIKFMEKNGIQFEYIVVDWFPINKQYLHQNEQLSELLKDKHIHNIVVDNSLAATEELNSLIFYEYFAKNAGIRAAKNDYVFILNSDIIVPQQMWNNIIDILKQDSPVTTNFFRPWERLNVEFIDDNRAEVRDSLVLKEPGLPDECVCGGYAGDFLIVERNTLIEKGRGYNEEDPGHRQRDKWQTGMDSEILWNLHNNGVTLEFLHSPYIHIKHGNAAPQVSTGRKQVDGVYRLNTHYTNKTDWGFINYKSQIIDNITTIIVE